MPICAHFLGTCVRLVNAAASFGAAGLHVLSPLTTTLNYSTFEPDGSIDVRLTYDHRVLDGAPIARALTAIEETLNGEIRDELLAGTPARRIHAERSSRLPRMCRRSGAWPDRPPADRRVPSAGRLAPPIVHLTCER